MQVVPLPDPVYTFVVINEPNVHRNKPEMHLETQ
jgi:hypothetical protein